MSILFGFFGMPGHMELLIVAAILLLLFGHRLPGVMRSLGRGVVEFKQGLSGVDDEEDEQPSKSGTESTEGKAKAKAQQDE